MNDVVAELAERGRALTPEDRERLVDLLLASLERPVDTEFEEGWRNELRRRVAVYERGEAILHDADDVLAEARKIAP